MRQMGVYRSHVRSQRFINLLPADMSVEGIFRRNGNIRRLKDLTEAIDHDPSSVDLTQDNPVQLAALLKKFLRELPEPLLTFKLHRLLIASQGTSPWHNYSNFTYHTSCSTSLRIGKTALPSHGLAPPSQEPP